MTIHAGENPLAGASEPVIYNVTMSVANFEYSQALPTNCRKYSIKPRQRNVEIKLAHTSGESGTNYITVPPGGHWEDLVGLSISTLYFQTETEGSVAEIKAWS